MHTTTQPGDFETAFSLFTALEATAELWFNPEQQMALMEGFDDFSGHDAGQVIALLDIEIATPAAAQEALTRLAYLLRILSHEAAHLNIALRYTRALTPSNSSGGGPAMSYGHRQEAAAEALRQLPTNSTLPADAGSPGHASQARLAPPTQPGRTHRARGGLRTETRPARGAARHRRPARRGATSTPTPPHSADRPKSSAASTGSPHRAGGTLPRSTN